MAVSKYFQFGALVTILSLLQLVQAQDQSGFISIDCGLSDITNYTDSTTGISYVSDANFTEFGENSAVARNYKEQTADQQFWGVRSFPRGYRNCYTLRPTRGRGTRYLIRARFMYGNYDGEDKRPTFDLYLGVDRWETVIIGDSDTVTSKGIMHTPLSDHIHVCLVNTGNGVPFISVLELRPIGSDVYTSENGTSLRLHNHYDFTSPTSNKSTRYKDDVYDRLWFPLQWKPFIDAPTSDAFSIKKNHFQLPVAIMGTAHTGNRSGGNIGIKWNEMNTSTKHFLFLHFSELEILQSNQSREFDIFINGDLWSGKEVPSYLSEGSIYSTEGFLPSNDGVIDIWLNSTENSTLPPLVNAMELYKLIRLSGQDTNQADVDAIFGVKTAYGLKRIDWQGDPCGPEGYIWDGLHCSYTADNPSRIVSLNLSSSELKGEISTFIGNLEMLENLDLSNNNLTGTVPEFLVHLSFLQVLNLKGNNFTSFPETLLSKKGLQLSIDTNAAATPCSSRSCGKKKSFVVPLIASLAGALFVILIMAVIIWIFKRRTHQDATNSRDGHEIEKSREENDVFGSKKQEFTFSEILEITNNLRRVLGEGGFGKVYHGYLNGKEVAVKILSSPSIQGHRQFHAELKLLMRVHHKNLTTLVGYCNEPTNIGLIYEYMAMGNLRSHLSEVRRNILSWENRLRIAIDTAQGLEYLHNGCKPPIIHRDVKPTNILLNHKFQAKLGDFGVSKIFPLEGTGNHISSTGIPGMATSIAGTPGYLDPEYCVTNWLNEKSDVYSFGVVLLELITARPVRIKNRENGHITHWVSAMLETGDVKRIVDPRLGGDYDLNTVWKAIEVSMACVSTTSNNRPTMSWVTTELKDCLVSELTRRDGRDASKDYASVQMISCNINSDISPVAR